MYQAGSQASLTMRLPANQSKKKDMQNRTRDMQNRTREGK